MKFNRFCSIFAAAILFILFPTFSTETFCHRPREHIIPDVTGKFNFHDIREYFEGLSLEGRNLHSILNERIFIFDPISQQCPNGCVIYACTKEDNTVIIAGGCPKDFMNACRYYKNSDFSIRLGMDDEMIYSDEEEYENDELLMVYGCNNKDRECIENKFMEYLNDDNDDLR